MPRTRRQAAQATQAGADNHSVSSASTSASEKLQDPLLKELAKDIEAAGGIAHFIGRDHKLANLLDNKVEIYGYRGDPVRGKITKKVYKWQEKHHKGRYVEDVLNNLQVKTQANKKKEKKKLKTTDEESSLSSDSDVGSSVLPVASRPKPVVKSRPTAQRKPRKLDLPTTIETSSEAPTKTRKMDTFMPSTSPKRGANAQERIIVNLERPEQNGGFYVYPIDAIPGLEEKTFHQGYFIMGPYDMRWAEFDDKTTWYKARVWSQNEVLITSPAWNFGPLKDHEMYERKFPPHINAAMVQSRHDWLPQRQFRSIKQTMLVFPVGTELTSKSIFDEATDDEWLKRTVHYPRYRVQNPRLADCTLVQPWVGFQVARADTKVKKLHRAEEDRTRSDLATEAEQDVDYTNDSAMGDSSSWHQQQQYEEHQHQQQYEEQQRVQQQLYQQQQQEQAARPYPNVESPSDDVLKRGDEAEADMVRSLDEGNQLLAAMGDDAEIEGGLRKRKSPSGSEGDKPPGSRISWFRVPE